eukprot:CAMPEP_0172674986 /NCGR_PEP_ID=MMETSP1074-20121228/13029_1 /TAXON_ID=2916 /ORGANISM="Ceratium fusus, Strain PA161109" /LENGTH=247 /DNA_ID=CAMNT_0013492431 /DNA_START=227 /DNA_END=970 /DNA_ORIENTATION=+
MELDQYLGSRFAVQRYVTLFTISNNMQRGVSWLKLRKDVCRKVQEYAMPNPVGMIAGVVASQTNMVGGSAVGCQQWMKCKNHASTRCSVYTTISIVSLTAMALIAVGAIAAVLTCVFKSFESGKKKKKQDEAKFTTMIVSIVAFVLPTGGVMSWIYVTQSQFKSLQYSAYYPYPAAHAGCYVAPVGCFMLFVAMVAGIIRAQPKKEETAGQDEYEEAEQLPAFPMGADLGMSMPPPDFMGMPPPPPP